MVLRNVFNAQKLGVKEIEGKIRESKAFVFMLDYYDKEMIKIGIKDKIKINGEEFIGLKHSLDITASLEYFREFPKREKAKAKLIEILGKPSFIKLPCGYGYDNSFIIRYDFFNKDKGIYERTFIEYNGDESR